MPEIRYEAAMSAARAILALAGVPATSERLDGVAHAALAAIWAAEGRLAEEPGPLLCPGCLLAIPAWPGEACRPCPRCERVMTHPDAVGRN